MKNVNLRKHTCTRAKDPESEPYQMAQERSSQPVLSNKTQSCNTSEHILDEDENLHASTSTKEYTGPKLHQTSQELSSQPDSSSARTPSCNTSEHILDEDEDVDINAWFGPEGTVSPLHHDPKHNCLAQVVGKKYIRLYSEEMTQYVYPHQGYLLNNTSQVRFEYIKGCCQEWQNNANFPWLE